jgi:hypothetical protein
LTPAVDEPPQLSHATITALYVPGFKLMLVFKCEPFAV